MVALDAAIAKSDASMPPANEESARSQIRKARARELQLEHLRPWDRSARGAGVFNPDQNEVTEPHLKMTDEPCWV